MVLLPGMMCDARLFAPQVEAFAGTYDVVVGDFSTGSDLEHLAESLLASLPERFNLAGLSMGGIVAMAMAGCAPERVTRLALLDTNHLADAADRRDLRNRQIADVRNGRLRDVIVDEMKPVYLAASNRGDQALLDLLVEMAMYLGPETFVNQTLALRDRPDQTEALRHYEGPALVLCGAEDTLCPPSRHDEIARLLPHPELAIIPDAGHITTLEQPAAVNAELGRWLARPVSGDEAP